jgi:hypothetical protein
MCWHLGFQKVLLLYASTARNSLSVLFCSIQEQIPCTLNKAVQLSGEWARPTRPTFMLTDFNRALPITYWSCRFG